MKNVLFSLVLISFFFTINNCSTDFDLYADYKVVPIVYCIADISDDTTWIKITKAFYGPGNVRLMAQNPDSSNYPYKLDASLTGKKDGVTLEPLILDTLTIHNKVITDTIINNDGDTIVLNPFYSPEQLVYYAVGKLDKDAEYTLSINKNDGETILATTGIVDDFHITEPAKRIIINQANYGSIKWLSARNGARYLFSIKFNYSEFAPGYNDTLKKYVDWFHQTLNTKTDEGREIMEISYSGADFYNLLEAKIPDILYVERWAENVEITIVCGSRVLVTYIDISAGNATIFDEVPTYSNIVGGAGIFASRHTIVTPIQLSVSTERNLIEDYNLGFKFKQK